MKRKLALILSLILIFTAVVPMTSTVFAANAAPTTLPAIRQWTGGSGKFTPNANTVLVYSGSEATEQIKLVQGFFKDTLGLDLAIKTSGTSNAIIFKTSASACNGEDEGYDLVATTSSITITAKTKIGLLYGGISVVQSVDADGYFPVGTAKDWPTYSVRSGLIDVARTYMPLPDLMDITRYMAWYKLNQIHVHINDNGKNGYNAFRLESDIPGLTAKDGYYTKEEYRQYQKDAAKYGVTVITEIDSPHHARCFADVNINGWSPKLLTSAADGVDSGADGRALDVRDEKTVQLILDLFTEYLGGSNPVILADTVHIGMDEYPKMTKLADACEDYLNTLIKHVNNYGYRARLWSSFGSNGFLEGATIESGLDYDIIYWDSTHSGIQETIDRKGKGILNYLNNYLYVVPGWNDQSWESFEDLMTSEAMSNLWTRWQVNQYSMWAAQPDLLPVDDPLMLGGAFSIWNDFGSAWYGITSRDVIDRLRNVVCFMAEKCWSGDDTGSKITYTNFENRLKKLGLRGGDVDIFHRDLPDGGININFENNSVPSYVTKSGNITNGEFVLTGTSYLSIPDYEYVGMPNTLSFELTLDSLPTGRAYIFNGPARTYLGETKKARFAIYIDPDGTIGFESLITESSDEYGYYDFSYDYKLSAGKKTKLTFTCSLATGKSANSTTLIVDDADPYAPINSLASKVTTSFSAYGTYSTLDIPLSKIGIGVKGKIDNIIVKGEVAKIPEDNTKNLVLGSSVKLVNGTDYVVSGVGFNAAAVTDGKIPTSVWSNGFYGIKKNDANPMYLEFDEFTSSKLTSATVVLGIDNPSGLAKPREMSIEALVNGQWVNAGKFDLSAIPGWSTTDKTVSAFTVNVSLAAANIVTTKVRLAVKPDNVHLIGEVQVMGKATSVPPPVVVPDPELVEHLAKGKTATDLSGKAPLESGNNVFKFGNVLTDGKAENVVDVTNKTWFGFQPYWNCTNYIGAVEVDLGSVQNVGDIKLHLANCDETFTLGSASDKIFGLEPVDVKIFVAGADKVYGEGIDVKTKSDANIIYWTDAVSVNKEIRYVKVQIELYNKPEEVFCPYALIDEIAVYEKAPEHECTFEGEWQSDENGHWKDCTCGESSESEPHVEGEWTEVEPAKVGVPGKEELRCTECNYLIDDRDIPALDDGGDEPDDKPSDKPVVETQLRGDVDNDGDVDADDYIILKRIFFGMAKFESYDAGCELRCDVDNDGDVDADDYIKLKRAFFGMYVIPEQNIEFEVEA